MAFTLTSIFLTNFPLILTIYTDDIANLQLSHINDLMQDCGNSIANVTSPICFTARVHLQQWSQQSVPMELHVHVILTDPNESH